MMFLNWKWIGLILGCLFLMTGCSAASQARWLGSFEKAGGAGQNFLDGSMKAGEFVVEVPMNTIADIMEVLGWVDSGDVGKAIREGM